MASSEICAEIKGKCDMTTNIRNLEPEVLADADQHFLIFSPATGNYLFMSKDPAILHRMHTKLEAHSERSFERNLFKFERFDDESLHLLNLDTEKHVYVSGDSVLGMERAPTEAKAKFEFERFGDSGCFLIKNNNKYLYVSKSKAGVPPCHVILAAEKVEDCSHVFQLVLVKNVKNAHIKYEFEKAHGIQQEIFNEVQEFENPSDTEMKKEVHVKVPGGTKQALKFEHGFEYSGNYLGGIPQQFVVESGTELGAFGEDFARSTDIGDMHIKSSSESRSETSNVTVDPKSKVTFTKTIMEGLLSIPFTIEVTTADKKVLRGSGTYVGNSSIYSSTDIKSESLDGSEE